MAQVSKRYTQRCQSQSGKRSGWVGKVGRELGEMRKVVKLGKREVRLHFTNQYCSL